MGVSVKVGSEMRVRHQGMEQKWVSEACSISEED